MHRRMSNAAFSFSIVTWLEDDELLVDELLVDELLRLPGLPELGTNRDAAVNTARNAVNGGAKPDSTVFIKESRSSFPQKCNRSEPPSQNRHIVGIVGVFSEEAQGEPFFFLPLLFLGGDVAFFGKQLTWKDRRHLLHDVSLVRPRLWQR